MTETKGGTLEEKLKEMAECPGAEIDDYGHTIHIACCDEFYTQSIARLIRALRECRKKRIQYAEMVSYETREDYGDSDDADLLAILEGKTE